MDSISNQNECTCNLDNKIVHSKRKLSNNSIDTHYFPQENQQEQLVPDNNRSLSEDVQQNTPWNDMAGVNNVTVTRILSGPPTKKERVPVKFNFYGQGDIYEERDMFGYKSEFDRPMFGLPEAREEVFWIQKLKTQRRTEVNNDDMVVPDF